VRWVITRKRREIIHAFLVQKDFMPAIRDLPLALCSQPVQRSVSIMTASSIALLVRIAMLEMMYALHVLLDIIKI
jgi:hypothetical protein